MDICWTKYPLFSSVFVPFYVHETKEAKAHWALTSSNHQPKNLLNRTITTIMDKKPIPIQKGILKFTISPKAVDLQIQEFPIFVWSLCKALLAVPQNREGT